MKPSFSFGYQKRSAHHPSVKSPGRRFFGVYAAALFFLASSAYGQDNSNSQTDIRPEDLGTVISVHIEYQHGQWRQLAAPEVIHCRAPKKAHRPT
ncbi:hypothetical protein MK280_15635, partial [Myxococcota bacterium]|nr:hypothetical protein [Myxococcota bacterium]